MPIKRARGNIRLGGCVYGAVNPVGTLLLFAATPAAQGSRPLPWVFPGDFRDRLRMSDLVVSGTIEDTSPAGNEVVDGSAVTANIAHLRVDRVFQGNAGANEIWFTWFTPPGNGFVWDGPPLADFRPARRYLVFLKRSGTGWQVSMPHYAIEVQLAMTPPRASLQDLSRVPVQQRYRGLAEELEDAALARPSGRAGTTAQPDMYFSPVFDLLGACATPFYRWFLASPDWRLREAASTWLELIRSRHLACGERRARRAQ